MVVTHNQHSDLVDAIQSILDCKREVTRIYLVDDGSDRSNKAVVRQLYTATRIMARAHMPYKLIELPHMGTGPARKLAYCHVINAGDIDLITSVDSDDTYGSELLAALRRTYIRCNGQVDLIVPRHILQIRESDKQRETITLKIPNIPIDLKHPSDELVEAWVQIARVGAAFGASVEAIKRLGSFEDGDMMDEWLQKYPRWAALGARLEYANVLPQQSYRYVLHDQKEQDNMRRFVHRARQHEAVRRGLRSAAERLMLDDSHALLA